MVYDGPVDWGKEQGVTCASLGSTLPRGQCPLGTPLPWSAWLLEISDAQAAFWPDPLPAEKRRTHCVSVRLNARELRLLDERRARVGMQRGEYLRVAALKRIPRPIPAILPW